MIGCRKYRQQKEQALNRPASTYDTHPSPNERFRLITQLGLAERPPAFEDGSPVWDLLPNAAGLQQEMTNRVQENVDAKIDNQSA